MPLIVADKSPSVSSSSVNYSDFENLLDRWLTPSYKATEKEPRWVCPLCNGNDVTTSRDPSKLGALKCWDCDGSGNDLIDPLGPEAKEDYAKFICAKNGEEYRGRESLSDSLPRAGIKKVRVPAKKKALAEVGGIYASAGFDAAIKFVEVSSPSIPLPLPEFSKRKARKKKGEAGGGEDVVDVIVYNHIYGDGKRIQRVEFPSQVRQSGKRSKEFYPLIPGDTPSGWTAKGVEVDLFGPYRIADIEGVVPAGGGGVFNSVLILEGELSCDWLVFGTGIAAITLPGASWSEAALRGVAARLKALGLQGVFMVDGDAAGLTKANTAIAAFEAEGAGILVVPTSFLGCDADDYIKAACNEGGIKYGGFMDGELKAKLKGEVGDAAHRAAVAALEKAAAKPVEAHDGDGGGDLHPEVPVNFLFVLKRMRRDYQRILRFSAREKGWFLYSTGEGMWEGIDELFVEQAIDRIFNSSGVFPSQHQVREVLSALKRSEGILVKEMAHSGSLIPFKNGVLNKLSGEFKGHSPANSILWKLPYEYSAPEGKSRASLMADCFPIIHWLYQAMGGEASDFQKVEVLLAYLAAVVRGKTGLQKYLECIGPAGSGKGTFLRLAEAIVGRKNTAASSLSRIEGNRFEAYRIISAPLILITDADRWVGDCAHLKALVGEDLLPTEQKGVQGVFGEDSCAKGLVILAGENSPNSSDSGGLYRRRLTVRFDKPVTEEERKDLIKISPSGVLEGELAPYVPALFPLLLSYSDEEIYNYCVKTATYAPALKGAKTTSILATSPIARWIEECCYYHRDLEGHTFESDLRIGVAKKVEGKYLNSNVHAYASYREWADENGLGHIGLNTFSDKVEEFMNVHLRLPVAKGRNAQGQTVITGMGLRMGNHTSFPRIVSDLFGAKTNDEGKLSKSLEGVAIAGDIRLYLAAKDERDGKGIDNPPSAIATPSDSLEFLPPLKTEPEDPEDLLKAETGSSKELEDPEGLSNSAQKKSNPIQEAHVAIPVSSKPKKRAKKSSDPSSSSATGDTAFSQPSEEAPKSSAFIVPTAPTGPVSAEAHASNSETPLYIEGTMNPETPLELPVSSISSTGDTLASPGQLEDDEFFNTIADENNYHFEYNDGSEEGGHEDSDYLLAVEEDEDDDDDDGWG
jgi:phage/plasmid-associated DNA primase